MRKLLTLLFVVLIVVAFAAPVGADGGFVLIGADGAWAQFDLGDDCWAMVSYVDAQVLNIFGSPIRKPFEGVDVQLYGVNGADCAPVGEVFIETDISNGHQDVDSKRLDWVSISNDYEVSDSSGFRAEINLRWDAVGDAFTQVQHQPGMRATHRIREVEVSGTLLIEGLGTFTTEEHLTWAQISHYTEIQRDTLP